MKQSLQNVPNVEEIKKNKKTIVSPIRKYSAAPIFGGSLFCGRMDLLWFPGTIYFFFCHWEKLYFFLSDFQKVVFN